MHPELLPLLPQHPHSHIQLSQLLWLSLHWWLVLLKLCDIPATSSSLRDQSWGQRFREELWHYITSLRFNIRYQYQIIGCLCALSEVTSGVASGNWDVRSWVLNLECEEWSGCLVMHILLGTFEIFAGHFGDISKITTIDIWLQMWVSWQFHVTFMWFQETYLQIHYHIQTSNSTVWILPFKKFMSDSLRMIKMTKIQIHLISNSFGFIGDSLWFRFRFTILFQPSELWIWNLLGLSIHIAWCHCHPQKYMCVCCCNDIHYTVWNPRTKDLCIYVT